MESDFNSVFTHFYNYSIFCDRREIGEEFHFILQCPHIFVFFNLRKHYVNKCFHEKSNIPKFSTQNIKISFIFSLNKIKKITISLDNFSDT